MILYTKKEKKKTDRDDNFFLAELSLQYSMTLKEYSVIQKFGDLHVFICWQSEDSKKKNHKFK